jgi:hypothetical protein
MRLFKSKSYFYLKENEHGAKMLTQRSPSRIKTDKTYMQLYKQVWDLRSVRWGAFLHASCILYVFYLLVLLN